MSAPRQRRERRANAHRLLVDAERGVLHMAKEWQVAYRRWDEESPEMAGARLRLSDAVERLRNAERDFEVVP